MHDCLFANQADKDSSLIGAIGSWRPPTSESRSPTGVDDDTRRMRATESSESANEERYDGSYRIVFQNRLRPHAAVGTGGCGGRRSDGSDGEVTSALRCGAFRPLRFEEIVGLQRLPGDAPAGLADLADTPGSATSRHSAAAARWHAHPLFGASCEHIE